VERCENVLGKNPESLLEIGYYVTYARVAHFLFSPGFNQNDNISKSVRIKLCSIKCDANLVDSFQFPVHGK
jgi:hypothetical protein